MQEDAKRLLPLVRGRTPCVLIETHEEAHARSITLEVLAHERAVDRSLIWSAGEGVRGPIDDEGEPIKDTANLAGALYWLREYLTPSRHTTVVLLDPAAHLEDPVALRQLRDLIHACETWGNTLILIEHSDATPAVIRSHAYRFELSLPDEAEIGRIIRQTLTQANRRRKVNISAKRKHVREMTKNLLGLTRRQIEDIIIECVSDDGWFDEKDANHVMASKRRVLHADGLLEYIESPSNLEDIGGLSRFKAWLRQRKRSFTPQAKAYGLDSPRGVLLLGVQGAGKSLCAKALAAGWQRPLLRLDPGVLFDRFIGESERRLRDALHQAEMMAPVILWIDEIEKGFASAASQSVDGGLSRRMFGTFLTWLQEHEAPVFLIATANDIEALPPELMRKGRFDEIFFVDLPTAAVRKKIAEIHIRKRDHDPYKIDFKAVAEATEGFSGAEIEQAIVAALHTCFDAKEPSLTTEAIVAAAKQSPPLSVTMAEKIAALREWAEGRVVPAGGP